jgi:SAM-dependent methyltransferase
MARTAFSQQTGMIIRSITTSPSKPIPRRKQTSSRRRDAKYCPFDVRRLLEPACGTGRLITELAARGYQMIGFDLSQPALSYLGRRLAAIGTCSIVRRNSLRPRASTGFALRALTNFQNRHPANTKTTLRLKNHSRRALPRQLRGEAAASVAIGFTAAP